MAVFFGVEEEVLGEENEREGVFQSIAHGVIRLGCEGDREVDLDGQE